MHRFPTRWWVSCTLALLLVGGGLVLAGEKDEVPADRLGLIVEIGDQRIETFAGETFTVEIAGTTVPVRITPKATKLFRHAGVSFEYPRAFSLEIDDSDPWNSQPLPSRLRHRFPDWQAKTSVQPSAS